MDGRWLVWIEETGDWHEVVPCDDAAVERAALALYEDERGEELRPDFALPPRCRQAARIVLRAAGETS